MPTALEYRLLQVARKQARLDEESYRMVLRNAAGVESAKELSQRGLEDVMAVFEDGGFRHQGKPADYWRMKVAMRGSFCSAPVVRKIEELAAGQRYDLAGLCRRVSKDRVSRPDRLNPREGSELVEMLKAISAREAAGRKEVIDAAEAAGGSQEPQPGARMPLEPGLASAGL